MNPDDEKNKKPHTFSDEELDELLKEDEDVEDLPQSKQSHIEDLDELTPEELQELKNHLEATKLNVDIAKWLNDLSIRYNQPFTPVMEKKEIEHIEQCKDECHRTIKTKEKKQKEVKQIEKVNSKPHTNRPKKTKREERMEEELKERNRTHKVNDYYRSKTKPEFPIIATVEGTRPVY